MPWHENVDPHRHSGESRNPLCTCRELKQKMDSGFRRNDENRGFQPKVPVLDLSTATSGLLAEKHRAGRIGGRILRHYTVTFDYADQTMYLKASAHDKPNGT